MKRDSYIIIFFSSVISDPDSFSFRQIRQAVGKTLIKPASRKAKNYVKKTSQIFIPFQPNLYRYILMLLLKKVNQPIKLQIGCYILKF